LRPHYLGKQRNLTEYTGDLIPIPVAERLREIANVANLVAEFFNGDATKVSLWFELANPMLGNISPRNLIRGGRHRRLLNFVLDAHEAERAAPPDADSPVVPSQSPRAAVKSKKKRRTICKVGATARSR
jgi:hypothetical protein